MTLDRLNCSTRTMSTVFKASPQWIRSLNQKGKRTLSRREMDERTILCSWIISLTVWLIIMSLAMIWRSQSTTQGAGRTAQYPPLSQNEFSKMQAIAETLERLLKQTNSSNDNREIKGMISRLRSKYTSTNSNVKLEQRLWSAENPSDRAIRWMAGFDEHDR